MSNFNWNAIYTWGSKISKYCKNQSLNLRLKICFRTVYCLLKLRASRTGSPNVDF